MADPQGYTVNYSFGNFQANAPASPLPGLKVDNELAEIAFAVASLVEAVKDVRRADGALQNNVVTFDSLAVGLQLTFDPTNGELVAAAIAETQANAAATQADRIAAAISAATATAQAILAEDAAASLNLSLYLPKANNLAGLADRAIARGNLDLGSVATFNVGGAANNIVQLDANAKLPAYDGSQLINIDTLPIGATIWLNGTTAPPGFLKENGALITRASYPRLTTYALASGNIVTEANWASGNQGAFSSGDLTTTLRLPDQRGEFIRAWDDGRGVDTSRVIGAAQSGMIESHFHTTNGLVITGGAGGFQFAGGGNLASNPNTNSTGGAETRPRNHAKLACIKAY